MGHNLTFAFTSIRLLHLPLSILRKNHAKTENKARRRQALQARRKRWIPACTVISQSHPHQETHQTQTPSPIARCNTYCRQAGGAIHVALFVISHRPAATGGGLARRSVKRIVRWIEFRSCRNLCFYTSSGLLVLLAQTAEIRSGIGNYAYHG
ncbi:MAG: hypothetical protein BECKG1743D_GA0114223_103046 [Candidatus Kentron sp. G]|nr:MAG: hypothetical protein BECKG1743F_GA0114225_102302 [Candidatus Kentron sp. G]VFN01731.1 MAG: hypothetical protein BECKG1743D_GA0114223_103046 [Candidatus Kentron sp. G]VFN05929.1 MAG: hypothetical protein BECKG1743E_GA0114224_109393 [Candidatus Kentron sp. G]